MFVKGSLISPDSFYQWQWGLSFWTLQGEKVPGIWLSQITVSLSPPAGSHLAVTRSVQVILSIAMPSHLPECCDYPPCLHPLKLVPAVLTRPPSPLIAKLGTRLISFLHWASYSSPKLSLFLVFFSWQFIRNQLWLNNSYTKNFAEWKITFICFAPSTHTLPGSGIHYFISSTCKYHLQSLVRKIHCFCMAELQHRVCNFKTGRHWSSLLYWFGTAWF